MRSRRIENDEDDENRPPSASVPVDIAAHREILRNRYNIGNDDDDDDDNGGYDDVEITASEMRPRSISGLVADQVRFKDLFRSFL